MACSTDRCAQEARGRCWDHPPPTQEGSAEHLGGDLSQSNPRLGWGENERHGMVGQGCSVRWCEQSEATARQAAQWLRALAPAACEAGW